MTTTRIAALTAALALTATPAFAGVGVPTPVEDPRPPATEAKSHGKAYGRYCRGQSKKHLKGKKGTAFSRCVKAMARLNKDERKSARAACKAMNKGVERRQCIRAARELARDEAEQGDEEQQPEPKESEGVDEDRDPDEDGDEDEDVL